MPASVGWTLQPLRVNTNHKFYDSYDVKIWYLIVWHKKKESIHKASASRVHNEFMAAYGQGILIL